jgi:multidrug efflux pump subunit AcrB
MRNDPNMRTVNVDWGERVPKLHFVLDQERLQLIGLSPEEAAQQLQFLLNGQTITQVRENIRAVNIVARSAGPERLDPTKLENFTLTTRNGKPIPLSQIGRVEIQSEDPLIKRRDRVPTITVRGDNIETTQPPDVSSEIWAKLAALRRALPENYRIEMAGSIEEANKANSALAPLFPIMLLLMLAVIIIQVRSFSAMWMVMLTGPLGLIGAVPALLIFQQPFGFNAILGLIGLSGILMRNTLILIGQIHSNQVDGLDPYHAIIEATVQRSRPVILTALAAVLAFIPLTHSVFWGSMAYVLIGGTAVGTVLTLAFLPALYAIWFRVGYVDAVRCNHGQHAPPVADLIYEHTA